jgi:ABC-type Zn uptake system ZnuABC Zn-binding protein ZnuA
VTRIGAVISFLKNLQILVAGVAFVVFALFIVGCSGGTAQEDATTSDAESAGPGTSSSAESTEHEGEVADDHGEIESGDHADEHEHSAEMLVLPELQAAELGGEPMKVIATTSIIGDVVAQVGGDAIELTTLIGIGQDAHSFEPTAEDLTAVARADVIFINGWDLEEGLVHDLEEIGEDVPIVAISANIAPLAPGEDELEHEEEGEEHEREHDEHEAGEEEHHEHSGADPHVWFSIHNVEQWVENVESVLSDLDPANVDAYESNAASYRSELESLEEYAASQLAQIPEEKRLLVTNHDSLSYFARDYGFELIGTILPAASTLAEPSASDLAGLIDKMELHELCTIFTEKSISDNLAQTVASELGGCSVVKVLPIYTGSIGMPDSGADSYIGMYRANVDAVVSGLRE